jgi:hypothetical protein
LVWLADAGANADSLVDAAKRREQSYRQAEFSLAVVEFVAKGQLQPPDPKEKPGTPAFPLTDLEVRSTNRFALDGPMTRYEDNHPLWSDSTHEFLNTRSVLVGDGDVIKHFFPAGVSGVGKPRGVIAGENYPGFRLPVLAPLTLHTRGLTPSISPFPVSDLKGRDQWLTIDGRRCREYATASADKITSAFVDEEDGFVIRRLRKLDKGKVQYQTDVQYAPGPFGPNPSKWILTEYGPAGKLTLRKEVTVTSFTHQPSASQLDLSFPEGCQVFDHRTSKH